MKKLTKFLSACLALTLALGMTVSAASPSTPSTNEVDVNKAAASTANDSISAPEGVTVSITAATTDQINNVIEKVINPAVVSSLGVTVKDVVFVFDIVADKNNTKMSFKVPHVEKGRSYALLHMNADGTVKEILPATCGSDGWITATFTTYSIYAVIEIDSNDSVAQPKSTSTSTSTTTSPQTGESLPIAGIVVVIMFACAFLCTRKFKHQ